MTDSADQSFWSTIPLVRAVREVSATSLRSDLLSGLSVALLAVPQCMAYALIAGLHPSYGLYAAMFAVAASSVIASSEHQITGPTANMSLVVGGVLHAVTTLPPEQAVLLLALEVGALQILFGALRLGNLARFVSHAVITGFITGAVLVIIGDRLIGLLAVEGSESQRFAVRVVHTVQQLLEQGLQPDLTLGLGLATVGVMVVLRLISRRIPAGLVLIVGGGVLSWGLGLQALGIELVGEIPAGFPPLELPPFDPEAMSELSGGAFALALLGSLQAISVGRSLAVSNRSDLDANRELIGQGVANVAVGLFKGFPGTASLSRSFFNLNLGAASRLAGVFSGVFVLLVLLFAAPLAYYIPLPVLAGLIIVVAAEVLDWAEIRLSLFTTRRDLVVFLATLLSVLVLELDTAIYVGVAVSIGLHLRKAAQLEMREYVVDERGELKHIVEVDERRHPQLAIIDINGEAFFGSAEQIRMRVRGVAGQSEDLEVIILRMKNATNLDITGAKMLEQLATELEEQDKTLMVSGATPQIRKVLVESEAAEAIGEDKILLAQNSLLASTRQALERAQAHLDRKARDEAESPAPPLRHTLNRLVADIDHPEEDPLEELPRTGEPQADDE